MCPPRPPFGDAARVVLSCYLLAGCGVLITWYADQRVNDEGNDDTTPTSAQSDTLLQELAQRFGLMALLSEAVYRRDLSRAERDGNGCAYLQAGAAASAPDYGMAARVKGQWRRWVPDRTAKAALPTVPAKAPVACMDDPTGLYYETYVLERQGKLVEAVIAFRGTDNRQGQTFRDWRSNIAAFFGFEPAQYAAARAQMIPLIEALSIVLAKPDGEAKVYATGHSLGGGLAQQAGYMSKKIRAVLTPRQ